MPYTEWSDGYLREDDYGVSLIINTNVNTFLFGFFTQTADHPSPFANLQLGAPGVNEQEVTIDQAWKTSMELIGMYPIGMQNGVLLQAVMGGSATTDEGGGVFEHIITPPVAVAGVLSQLPSFTIHSERTGTSDDWSTQYKGVKVAALLLTCGFTQKYLVARVDWIARKEVKQTFMLANKPALPTTANKKIYHWSDMTITLDGNPIEGLAYLEFLISPDFTPINEENWEGVTWDAQYITDLIESPLKKYQLILDIHTESSVIWAEVIAMSNTKTIVITFKRTDNDYIEITLTNCQFLGNPKKTPYKEELTERTTIVPLGVSIKIRDGLAGSDYGE